MQRHGQFAAITITFFYSSLLHGLNIECSAVLLSLGFFSSVEIGFRKFLANSFDACVESKQCRTCSHKYKKDHVWVQVFNDGFKIFIIVQLVYTGYIMETLFQDLTLWERIQAVHSRWYDLGYICHILAFIMYFLTITF